MKYPAPVLCSPKLSTSITLLRAPLNRRHVTLPNIGWSGEQPELLRDVVQPSAPRARVSLQEPLRTDRFSQLRALADDLNQDIRECASSDLFHEFPNNLKPDSIPYPLEGDFIAATHGLLTKCSVMKTLVNESLYKAQITKQTL
jgi:hypothetical protein